MILHIGRTPFTRASRWERVAQRHTLCSFAWDVDDFDFLRSAWHFVSFKLSVNQDGTYNPVCMVDGVAHGRSAAALVLVPVGNMTVVAGFTATTNQAIEAYYDNVVDDAMQ